MTETAQEAIEKSFAPKELTRSAGTVTNREQREILRSVQGEDMTEVAIFFRRLNAEGSGQ